MCLISEWHGDLIRRWVYGMKVKACVRGWRDHWREHLLIDIVLIVLCKRRHNCLYSWSWILISPRWRWTQKLCQSRKKIIASAQSLHVITRNVKCCPSHSGPHISSCSLSHTLPDNPKPCNSLRPTSIIQLPLLSYPHTNINIYFPPFNTFIRALFIALHFPFSTFDHSIMIFLHMGSIQMFYYVHMHGENVLLHNSLQKFSVSYFLQKW